MKIHIFGLLSLILFSSLSEAKLQTKPKKGRFKEFAALKVVAGIGSIVGGTVLAAQGIIKYYNPPEYSRYSIDSDDELESNQSLIKKIENIIIRKRSIILPAPLIITGIILAIKGIKDYQEITEEEKSLVYPIEMLI